MIKLTEKQKIISKHLSGISNRDIAKELHISKNTVNKYVNEYDSAQAALVAQNPTVDQEEIIETFMERPKYDSTNRRKRKVTKVVIDLIEDCLKENDVKRARGRKKQVMKITDIWEYVQGKGHDLSYGTIYNIIREHEERTRDAYIRQTYDPGISCEFDWGEVELIINGHKKIYQIAVFIPPYSDACFAKLYERQDTAAFLQSHADYYEYIGGVFHQMVYDNMRVAVKKFVGINEKEPTSALLSLSIYYGFKFRFCNIASGNEKGSVERGVEFIRRKAFSNPGEDHFGSLSDANKHLLERCEKLNKSINGELSKELLLCEEKKHLLTLLPRYECCNKLNTKIDKYSTFIFETNHYSVPDTLVGKTLEVKVYTDKLVVLHNGEQVAQHERIYKKYGWKIDIYHYLRTLNKKPGALPRSTALLQADTQIKEIYQKYYTESVREFLQVLEVIREKGLEEVISAIDALNILAPGDYSADKVKTICESRSGINRIKPGTDVLSKKSKDTLVNYDMLLSVLSRKAVM